MENNLSGSLWPEVVSCDVYERQTMCFWFCDTFKQVYVCAHVYCNVIIWIEHCVSGVMGCLQWEKPKGVAL